MKKELKTKDAKNKMVSVPILLWFRGHGIVRDAGYIIFDKGASAC